MNINLVINFSECFKYYSYGKYIITKYETNADESGKILNFYGIIILSGLAYSLSLEFGELK